MITEIKEATVFKVNGKSFDTLGAAQRCSRAKELTNLIEKLFKPQGKKSISDVSAHAIISVVSQDVDTYKAFKEIINFWIRKQKQRGNLYLSDEEL